VVCFAGEKAQVNLLGRRAKIELEFSEKVSLLLRKFKDWESRLSQNGVEAEFLLGAGELRRALLQMPVENPGDVEVFLHVKSHWISGKTTSQARLFLSQNGVALDQEVAAIFGPTNYGQTNEQIFLISLKRKREKKSKQSFMGTWMMRLRKKNLGHFQHHEKMILLGR
jgi:hypothetical protein